MPLQRTPVNVRRDVNQETEDITTPPLARTEAVAEERDYYDDTGNFLEQDDADYQHDDIHEGDWVTTEVLEVMNDRLKQEMEEKMKEMEERMVNTILRAMQLQNANTIAIPPPPHSSSNPPPLPSRNSRTPSPAQSITSIPGSVRHQTRIVRTPSPTQSIMSASSSNHVNDIAKELMKLIPRYDGTGGIQKLLEFIDNFEDFIESAELPSKSELTVATAKLTGDAKMWWREHRETTPVSSTERIRTWAMLKQALMNMFAPPENANIVREKLRNIKQKGTVAEYNAAFRRLTMQLTNLSFAEAEFEYLRGLNPHIRDLVRTQKDNLTDLRTLQLACLRLDTHHDSKQKRNDEALAVNSSNSSSSSSSTKSAPQTYNNRGRGRGHFRGRGKAPTNRNMSKIICGICDVTGNHFTYKCPKLDEMKDAYKQKIASNANNGAQANFTCGPATIIDSGATQHMFNCLDMFDTAIPQKSTITCANSQEC
jgi:hypothetical protein